MYEFIEVNKESESHIKILYRLLKEREYNISHTTIPKLEEHCEFVSNHPYRRWYLIKNENSYKGSIYITSDNVIGVNILYPKTHEYVEVIKTIIENHRPLKPIKSIRSKYFSINANPSNLILIEALNILGTEHIQNTYSLNNYTY